jgi:hypothetical protein
MKNLYTLKLCDFGSSMCYIGSRVIYLCWLLRGQWETRDESSGYIKDGQFLDKLIDC